MGLSLREPQFSELIKGNVDPPLLEVITDHFTQNRGSSFDQFLDIARDRFIHLHGLSLNIAGFDPLQHEHINKIRELKEITGAQIVSEHLCVSTAAGYNSFELLPFPFTKPMLEHIENRIRKVQDQLGFNFLLENISTYFRFRMDQIPEVEFMNELHNRTGVGFLLDINNLLVNEQNHKTNSLDIIKGFIKESIGAYHLAGHSDEGTFLFDTHDREVPDQVWYLFQEALKHNGPHPTTIERDENIPAGALLMKEAKKAESIMNHSI